MFKGLITRNTPKNVGHLLRSNSISMSAINPVFMYECTRCGASGPDAGAGAFRAPCRD
jgi:hypothetical protein